VATETDEEHTYHPGVREYVEIGVILAVMTALEVAIFYAPIISEVAIPALILLTILKFVLVIFWFMHLRFDDKVFRRMLFAGVVLAGVLFGIVLLIFTFSSPVAQA
jgi:cytochrome c oxidase subunit IV